jgi:hypothetical protein
MDRLKIEGDATRTVALRLLGDLEANTPWLEISISQAFTKSLSEASDEPVTPEESEASGNVTIPSNL